MAQEIFINKTLNEVRVAFIENKQVQEVFIERKNKSSIVGSVFVGKVLRLLPGMQAAFVEIGLARAAFLHAKDIQTNHTESLDITKLLTEGQKIIVQVVKDQLGSKGARLTTSISLPGRYLVFMPGYAFVGVSNKIVDVAERDRLRSSVENKDEITGRCDTGFIVRTAAIGVAKAELEADKAYLQRLWQDIQSNSVDRPYGQLLYQDLPVYLRVLRDLLNDEVMQVKIDNAEIYQQCLAFVLKFAPTYERAIVLYNEDRNLFDIYHIENEIQQALKRKVPLRSGGYLVFDQTEAMHTVDVNTGSFTGSIDLEETIFQTNLEAINIIARQIRLRNLGGMIIIDFIDMESLAHKQILVSKLEEVLAKDRVKTSINFIENIGVVAMTRKRVQPSLAKLLCEPCAVCQGNGVVKTVDTLCYEILRDIKQATLGIRDANCLVLASSLVVDKILQDGALAIKHLEETNAMSIRLQAEPGYLQEQFEIIFT